MNVLLIISEGCGSMLWVAWVGIRATALKPRTRSRKFSGFSLAVSQPLLHQSKPTKMDEEFSMVPPLLQLCSYQIASDMRKFPDISFMPPDLKELLFGYVLCQDGELNSSQLQPFLDADIQVVNLANREVRWTKNFIDHLMLYCPNLREIDFTAVSTVRDNLVSELVQKCTTLEVLKLNFCHNVNGWCIPDFGSLKHL